MRKLGSWALAFAFCVYAGLSQSSGAPPSVPVRGGGDHLPVPFKAFNTKVELAEGEYYVLEGSIVVTGATTYLEVDLEAHPWLATKKRKEFPYYSLEGARAFWRKFEGVRVRLQGQAFMQSDDSIGLRLIPNSRLGLMMMDQQTSSWVDAEF
jgi:hypothetical protein